jgi:tRNA nucleotidyltransferase (CCA-adding enzyme)
MTLSNNLIEFNLPNDVKAIMNAFEGGGFEIFLVGGCVRDTLLNRLVNDWDFCTKATPEEIILVCDKCGFKYIPTGLKHGTITVVLNNEGYEITTYRLDGDYSDGRHPNKVFFTTSLKEDLARRDFTINALAYSEKEKLIDYFNGLEDLENQLIRCVGNPEERFKEDNLRRLRAIRFAAQLGFGIETETYKNIAMSPESLNCLSVERIRDELSKILLSNNSAYGIRELSKLGLQRYIIPELEKCVGFHQHNKHHDKDVLEHTLCVVENTTAKLDLRLAALLHDIAKPICMEIDKAGQGHFLEHDVKGAIIAEEILTRLRFDNKTIAKVSKLVRYHMNKYEKIKLSSIKKFMTRVGIEDLEDLFELQIADIKSTALEYQNYDKIIAVREECRRIIRQKEPLKIKDLSINGADLIEIGFKPGKEMGNTLNDLLTLVLENPELNNRVKLLELVKNERSKK